MYLGVDLGTSSLKVLLADKAGKIIDSAKREYPVSIPQIGYSEQNPDDWFNAFTGTITALRARHNLKEVRAVSFCGQMHGLVILDKHDNVIRPAILWNDNRTVAECEYLNGVIGKDKLLEWTGNIAFAGFTAPKLLWLKKHEPENFERIAKIMLPKDYLVYRMSGVFASDVSDNSGTLYFDVKNKKWSCEMLEILGVSQNQLPRIFESRDIVGGVCAGFAQYSGLPETAKVVAGGGDQAVGAIGTGTIGEDALSISLGTSGVVFAGSDDFRVADGGLHSFCHADGQFHLMGCMLSAAGGVDFWLNKILQTDNFTADIAAIKNAKAEGLFFLPYLAGERSPINDPYAKGVFYGLTLAHTREDMTRAVVEGVSLGLKDCYLAIKKTGVKPKFAGVIGGGVKSPDWLEILADCLGIEIRTIDTNDGGGLGAVILAMVADGVFPDIKTACKELIRYDKSYRPDKNRKKEYDVKYESFKRLYNTVKGY